MKKFLCALLTLAILATTCLGAGAKSAVTGKNWMSTISTNTSLADLNLPGTHDSAAKKVAFGFKAMCQHNTIITQLSSGARFLDIRLAYDESVIGGLKLVHSVLTCKNKYGSPLTLMEVLDKCYAFLKENPTEAVLFCVKQDSGNNTDAFCKALYSQINENPQYWYTKNKIPTLKQSAGKLVLLNRFSTSYKGADDSNCGLNLTAWPQQTEKVTDAVETPVTSVSGKNLDFVIIQDRFKLGTGAKWEAFQSLATTPKPKGTLVLNYLSTATGIGPLTCARTLNAKFKENAKSLLKSKTVGVVIFDFITAEIAHSVWSSNEGANVKLQQGYDYTTPPLTSWDLVIPVGVIVLAIIALVLWLIFRDDSLPIPY